MRIHRFYLNWRMTLKYARQHHHNSWRCRKVYEDPPGSTRIQHDQPWSTHDQPGSTKINQDPLGFTRICFFPLDIFWYLSVSKKKNQNKDEYELWCEIISYFIFFASFWRFKNLDEQYYVVLDPDGSRWIPVDPGGSRWILVDPGGSS